MRFTLYFLVVIIFAMAGEGSYFFEPFTESFGRRLKVDKFYYPGKTKYQFVQCFYNEFLGKVLFLDKRIQSAQIDEYIYHESLVHPALITHPSPREVLVIGGGEGATLREVLRHSTVEKVIMVDIDRELVELCQKYLPEWSKGAFSNPKTDLIFKDARPFVEKTREKFDVIISDLTEPIEQGPSVFLFTEEFFSKNFAANLTRGINIPIIFLGAKLDPMFPSKKIKELASQIKNSQVIILEGDDHSMTANIDRRIEVYKQQHHWSILTRPSVVDFNLPLDRQDCPNYIFIIECGAGLPACIAGYPTRVTSRRPVGDRRRFANCRE